MIYILCANPSLDVFMEVESFQLGELHRCNKQEIQVGGKGINVSYVLKQFGVKSMLLGFISGKIGKTIKEMVLEAGLNEAFIDVKNGESRINVKLLETLETEINGKGPIVDAIYQEELLNQIQNFSKEDILVISGSYPPGIQEDFIQRMGEILNQKGCKFIVDQSKDALIESLKYHPFLIKPNKNEAEEILGVSIRDKQDGFQCAKKLIELGAMNVLMSFGKDGALFLSQDGARLQDEGLKGICQSSIGAGDSMLAGFLAGLIKDQTIEEAFLLGLASGSATAFSKGLASSEEIHTCLNLLKNTRKKEHFKKRNKKSML